MSIQTTMLHTAQNIQTRDHYFILLSVNIKRKRIIHRLLPGTQIHFLITPVTPNTFPLSLSLKLYLSSHNFNSLYNQRLILPLIIIFNKWRDQRTIFPVEHNIQSLKAIIQSQSNHFIPIAFWVLKIRCSILERTYLSLWDCLVLLNIIISNHILLQKTGFYSFICWLIYSTIYFYDIYVIHIICIHTHIFMLYIYD